jgi:hypothetical protein
MLTRYNPQTLRYGNNSVDGEEVFFISNPGLGLWTYREKLLVQTHDRNLETRSSEPAQA